MRKHTPWIIALLSIVLPMLQAEWHYRYPLPATDASGAALYAVHRP